MNEETAELRRSAFTLVSGVAQASVAMTSTAVSWLFAEPKEIPGRALGVGVGSFVLVYLTDDRTWMWAAYGGSWLVGALAVGSRAGYFEVKATPADGDTETEEGEPEEEDDTPHDDQEMGEWDDEDGTTPEDDQGNTGEQPTDNSAVYRFIEQQTAAGAAGHLTYKGRGIPVDELRASLAAKGSTAAAGWQRTDVIAYLNQIGIRHRDQMKFTTTDETGQKKRHNLPGVHIQDLTEDLGHTPRLPAHLVPDLTPTNPLTPTPTGAPTPPLARPSLSTVKDEETEGVA